LDRPLTGEETATALRDECNHFGVNPQELLPLECGVSPDEDALERWQNLLAPYIEARLTQALGGSDFKILMETLFKHDATIKVDTENVVVRFALAKHPIALRMAGLDFDPGWIPAASRVVRFEYE